jgi:hypothetical protein
VYNEIPVVGYQGFKSNYRPQTTQIFHRKDPFFNLNPLVPKMKEFKDVQERQEFSQTSAGFQRAVMQQTRNKTESLTGEDNQLKLPVVGYTGHRPAYRAQNFYGKNFRDCTI